MSEAAREGPRKIGCTLPGRWGRSSNDARWACDAQAFVRVVKGEWPATRGDERHPLRGCLEVVDRLVGGSTRHVSIATHDARLARAALSRLIGGGRSCDLEVIQGRPMRGALRIARELEVPVRVYVPFGTAFAGYAARWALRHPATAAWWLVQSSGSPAARA